MTDLPITSDLTALAILGLILLSVPVSLRRRKLSISRGDGGDETLGRRIRAQGNYIEYVPIALIAFGLAEAGGSTAPTLCWIAAAFIAGRVLHVWGMWAGILPPRAIGMLITWLSLLAIGGALVCNYY
ncbi:MAG TPA: MAPEG family protein [Caulobacteraceae bacterium]